jgi:hypothetical protein
MAENVQRDDHDSHPGVGYELSDLKAKNIALFAAALAITIALVLLVSYWLFEFAAVQQAEKQPPPSPLASTREPTPEPRLQVHAPKELQEMRAAEDALLKNYGWIDQKAGIVRIPVDRAIELLAKKGLPARAEDKIQELKIERQKTNGSNR